MVNEEITNTKYGYKEIVREATKSVVHHSWPLLFLWEEKLVDNWQLLQRENKHPVKCQRLESQFPVLIEDSCKPVCRRIDFSESTKLKTHFNNLIQKSL